MERWDAKLQVELLSGRISRGEPSPWWEEWEVDALEIESLYAWEMGGSQVLGRLSASMLLLQKGGRRERKGAGLWPWLLALSVPILGFCLSVIGGAALSLLYYC